MFIHYPSETVKVKVGLLQDFVETKKNLWWTSYLGRIRKTWIDGIKGISFPFEITFVLHVKVDFVDTALPNIRTNKQTNKQTNRLCLEAGREGMEIL